MESTEVLRGELREQIDGEIDNARHSAPDRSARTGERIDIRNVAPDDGRYVTLEEYWARWYENPYPDIDASYEWNNGRLEAKPLSNRRQLDLYKWFLLILHCNVKRFDHAALINLETGFVLTIADPAEPSGERVQVRKPDIGVILNSNPVSWGGIDQRHFAGVCDLVVESLSDSSLAEVRRDTEEKKRDYALAGVKEYYILDPGGEHMRLYRLTPGGHYEEIRPDDEGVVRSEALPGFQFRMEDLERQPELEELALDNVYSGYVLLRYQASVAKAAAEAQRADSEAAARQQAEEQAAVEAQRADTEAQRADTEAQRADTEAQRANREAQRADSEAVARQQAEEQAEEEAAARQQAEERSQALEAELARLRQRLS